MSTKQIAIIGGGISGLSAGCYAQMNGYQSTIYESHSITGGLCTGWRRQGYTFDGCIHWLVDSAPGGSLYPVWQELGAVQGREMHDPEAFWRFADTDGRTFHLYVDPDRLEAHMKELSPADAAPVEELCRIIRKFRSFSIPVGKPRELMNAWDGAKFMLRFGRYLKDLQATVDTTLAEFAKRFEDPLLAEGIVEAIGPDAPLMALTSTLAAMSRQAAGFPLGGSLGFAKAIEDRYTGLGGTVRCNARVAQVVEKNGIATGIMLEDGTRIDADYVVCTADLRWTLTKLLDGTRQHETHKLLLESGEVYPSAAQVSFGVRKVISELDDCAGEAFRLPVPIQLGNSETSWLGVKSYGFDPSLAPAGCSAVIAFIPCEWEYWKDLSADPEAYRREKERLAQIVSDAIDARYPGFKDAIEVTDVSTPLTYERYTGNWKGTFMSWNLKSDFQRKHGYVRKTVPGLENFYLASMWTQPPGGLPSAAVVGRDTIQILCAKDGKRFVTTTP